MNPLFVITAIRGLLRIGKTAADAYAQRAQTKPILLPDADFLKADPRETVMLVADAYPEFKNLLETDDGLSQLWQNNRFIDDAPGAEDAVLAVAYRFHTLRSPADSDLGTQPADEVAGGMMIGQWADGKGPVRPWTRVIVAMADVALEYVAARPEILGIGGDGEKLIGAVALSISTAIPDAHTRDALGPKDRFAERLSALVLHAGLKTLTEKSDLVFKEEHLQELLKQTLPPIIKALPDNVIDQIKWRQVNDALLGPAISGALGAIASNQQAFLGKGVAADKAAGVLVNALLNAAKDLAPSERFKKDALVALFQATANAASENPELVLGKLLNKDLSNEANRKASATLFLNLFKNVTGALAEEQQDLGIAVAVAAINGLKTSVPVLVKDGHAWEIVIEDITIGILDGFGKAIGDPELTLEDTLLTKQQLIDMARIAIDHVAETPHLIANGNDELKRIVTSLATAMSKDENLLLTSKDWGKIVGVTMQEAAINPGRLFGLNTSSQEGLLAATIIGGILGAAGEDFKKADRKVGPVLIGKTLREAIIVTLRGISGNVEQAFEQHDTINTLATKLNEAVATRGLSMGGKEWLKLFRTLLPDVLSKGTIPTLDDDTILDLLAK